MVARSLTMKQRKFIAAYIGQANGNATEAARIAGYKGTDKALSVVGADNLVKPSIQNELAKLVAPMATGGIRDVANRVDGYINRLGEFAMIVQDRAAADDGHPGMRSGWLAKRVRINRRYDKRTGELVSEH